MQSLLSSPGGFSSRRFLADCQQTLRGSNGGWKPGWALDVLETIFHGFSGVLKETLHSPCLWELEKYKQGAAGSLELIKSKHRASAVGESLLSFIMSALHRCLLSSLPLAHAEHCNTPRESVSGYQEVQGRNAMVFPYQPCLSVVPRLQAPLCCHCKDGE